jgi:hypothetical protein
MERFMDRLVNAVTAFRTFAEMRAAMAGGYVPTLNGAGKYRQLALALRRQGYRVFRDGRTR